MERSHEVLLRSTRTAREKLHVVLERSHEEFSRLTRTAGWKSYVVFFCDTAVSRRVVAFDENSAWKVARSFWCYIILYRVFVYDPNLSLTCPRADGGALYRVPTCQSFSD